MIKGTRFASLGARYAHHNRRRGERFVYGGRESVDALRRALGPRARGWTLNPGCRDGSLARALDLWRGAWFEPDPAHLRQFSPGGVLLAILVPRFTPIHIAPRVGRWAAIWWRMLSNDLVWSAVRA
jgi:hypothetical protein